MDSDDYKKIQKAAIEEAVFREEGLRKAFDGKGIYRNDAEYTANYFGRIGGFHAGVEYERKQKESKNE